MCNARKGDRTKILSHGTLFCVMQMVNGEEIPG